MELLNLKSDDPFRDATDEEDRKFGINREQPIHIRLMQRNARKKITTCEGLPQNINFNKIVRALRHNFHCSACVVEDKRFGKVIKIQGNHVNDVIAFLTETRIGLPSQIKVHSALTDFQKLI